MSALLSNLAAAFVAIPLLGYVVVFVITKLATKQHRRAVKTASDLSAPLFIMSVYYLISVIWKTPFVWTVFILLLLLGAARAFARWIVHGKSRFFSKFIRVYWRSTFLLFFFVYFLLMLIGLVRSVWVAF